MASQEWKHQVKVPRENDEVLEVPPDPARDNRYPVLLTAIGVLVGADGGCCGSSGCEGTESG
jgi:hypothetical protein